MKPVLIQVISYLHTKSVSLAWLSNKHTRIKTNNVENMKLKPNLHSRTKPELKRWVQTTFLKLTSNSVQWEYFSEWEVRQTSCTTLRRVSKPVTCIRYIIPDRFSWIPKCSSSRCFKSALERASHNIRCILRCCGTILRLCLWLWRFNVYRLFWNNAVCWQYCSRHRASVRVWCKSIER